MDKKFYQEPTMKVFLLKQRAHLLVGSEIILMKVIPLVTENLVKY